MVWRCGSEKLKQSFSILCRLPRNSCEMKGFSLGSVSLDAALVEEAPGAFVDHGSPLVHVTVDALHVKEEPEWENMAGASGVSSVAAQAELEDGLVLGPKHLQGPDKAGLPVTPTPKHASPVTGCLERDSEGHVFDYSVKVEYVYNAEPLTDKAKCVSECVHLSTEVKHGPEPITIEIKSEPITDKVIDSENFSVRSELTADLTESQDIEDNASNEDGALSAQQQTIRDDSYINKQNNKRPKRFFCNTCKKGFKSISDLQRHNRTHTGERPYACQLCSVNFRQARHLKDHMLTHTGETPHSCDTCKKPFRFFSGLKRHQLTHMGKRPNNRICNICNKSFVDTCSLKRHGLVHKDIKPYSCGICERNFRLLGNLKKHELVHMARQYSCGTCKKEFTELRFLKDHEQSHTGVKPYSCKICAKDFRKLSFVKRHERIHSDVKPFSCGTCEKTFVDRSGLKKHQQRQAGLCSSNKNFFIISNSV